MYFSQLYLKVDCPKIPEKPVYALSLNSISFTIPYGLDGSIRSQRLEIPWYNNKWQCKIHIGNNVNVIWNWFKTTLSRSKSP